MKWWYEEKVTCNQEIEKKKNLAEVSKSSFGRVHNAATGARIAGCCIRMFSVFRLLQCSLSHPNPCRSNLSQWCTFSFQLTHNSYFQVFSNQCQNHKCVPKTSETQAYQIKKNVYDFYLPHQIYRSGEEIWEQQFLPDRVKIAEGFEVCSIFFSLSLPLFLPFSEIFTSFLLFLVSTRVPFGETFHLGKNARQNFPP